MIPFATPKLVIGIAVTMGAIYTADQFLAHLEHRELDAQARHEYTTGLSLLHDGRNKEAIEAFRSARVLDREDASFKLALADAFIRDHQPQRAIDTLSEILDKDSNDGQANLLMARAMDGQQQYSNADSYYHRAIYGTWPPPNGESQQVNARIELARWQAGRGDRKGLLSELIMLEPFAATYPTIARDLPFLYRQAGSTGRAITAYRNWLHSNPNDQEAYAGLAETEMQTGNFRGARQAFDRAAELKPDDPALKRDAEVALTAMELDPTPRGLSTQDKLERSTRILSLAIAGVAPCSTDELVQKAQTLLAQKNPAVSNEAAEMRLDYSETIWNTRPHSCPQQANDELLTDLIRKLAQ